MRPEYYADLFRQYNTYVRNYNKDKSIYKIACGPNSDDYHWTEVLMDVAGRFMDGLSFHYYTRANEDRSDRGSAFDFDVEDYYRTLFSTWKMKEYLHGHSIIMDRYDPGKRVGLIVDEWGS